MQVQQTNLRTKYEIESEFDAKYTFYDLGYNLRPTEITGFLGRYQLQFLEENIKIRENNYLIFEQDIKRNRDLTTPEHAHITRSLKFCTSGDMQDTCIKSTIYCPFFVFQCRSQTYDRRKYTETTVLYKICAQVL